jgi:energy-coupling factor transporter ATP-binding protein EcfA2
VDGRNGSGKYTLLRMIAGILTPSTGKIADRPHTGYVPERFPAALPFSGRDYPMHLGRVHGPRGRVLAARAEEYLTRLGAGSFALRPMGGVEVVREDAGHLVIRADAALSDDVLRAGVGSVAGVLCNPPIIRRTGAAILGTASAVIAGLVAGVSPANAALGQRRPHAAGWPAALPIMVAATAVALS